MSSNKKHSKIRNTGILFELLTRQITVDVLNNNKKAQAANILKEFFNKKTQLGREYELYKVLTTENYKSENKANHLVDAVVDARKKLKETSLWNWMEVSIYEWFLLHKSQLLFLDLVKN